jgi:predicted DsbA family dithiol-disulfide isomerase
MLGKAAGIDFRFDVRTHWQPVDSQRMLLWAARAGRAEQFMSALNARHFEAAESASERPTLLAAAAEAGLDAAAAETFLATDELVDDVWRSYGATIRTHGIHAIPYFVFSCAAAGRAGGPFRERGDKEPVIVNGSMDAPTFLAIFEQLHGEVLAARAAVRGGGGGGGGDSGCASQ